MKVRPVFLVALAGAIGLAIWRRKDVATTAKLLYGREERMIRLAFRKAAVATGLNPDFMEAIPRVESAYKMSAVNKSGSDGARGGSYGPSQISMLTARGHGYQGPMEALNKDADLAAYWSAVILKAAHKRKPLSTLADYVAAWNAGRDDADKNNDGNLEELGPNHQTNKDYLPKAKAALAYVQSTKGAIA